MTKPDWCPTDVWVQVAGLYIISENFDDRDLGTVARAILAERERALEEAAVVAERVGIPMVTHRPQLKVLMVPVEIASAIRALKETP